ncbi:MAG: glutamate synthase subunit alpha, partial [bacterium]|nr:glutamate synthase subunit alpha [bacterium]
MKAQGLYDPRYEHDSCGAGFVVNIKGERSHQIIEHGLQVLLNLAHRGACGSEHNSGDGAGILFQLPHQFFQKVAQEAGFSLPEPGWYGVGMIFLPQDEPLRAQCEKVLTDIIEEEGQSILSWRDVPTLDATLGKTARDCQPVMRQVFIQRNQEIADDLAFERKLFVIKNRVETTVRHLGVHESDNFYIASMSYRTIVYKGMLTCEQVEEYFPDLKDPLVDTAIILVHSRFST